MEEKIKEVIEKLRPYVQEDGGDLEFVDYYAKDKVVLIRLHGECVNCALSERTVKTVIQEVLVQMFPDEVESVEAVR